MLSTMDPSPDVVIVERDFTSLARYTVRLAAIVRNGRVDDGVIAMFRDFFESSPKPLRLTGTRREIGDVDFEVMMFEAEVLL